MRKSASWICTVVALFLCVGASAQEPRYDIQASVDTTREIISASQKVTFTNNTSKPTDAVYFHMYPNRLYSKKEQAFFLRYAGYFKVDPYPAGFPSDDVHIRSVAEGDQALTYAIEGEDKTLLKVVLPKVLGPQESVTFELKYTVPIPHGYGRFGFNRNIWALSRWYPILSVYNENGWANYPFYPFHRPFFSDASFYHVVLKVPSDQTVIHTGDLIKEENTDGGYKTVEIDTKLPVREFTVAMSPNYRFVEGSFNNVVIRSFYLPGHQKKAEEALADAKSMMEYYSGKFGAYPYSSFSIAPVYLGYGGEQMSNMIFIDTRVYDLPSFLPRYFDFLIAHETGHQWFYNILGIDSFNQIWMEEGFNSYFTSEYLERKYGANADVVDTSRLPKWAQDYLVPHLTFKGSRDVRYKMMARQSLDHPIIDKLSGYNEPSSIFSLAYGKGSLVVEMLRNLVGQETFDRIYARIFKEYAHKNFDLKDFLRICNEESGRDLSAFFDDWLHSDKKFDVAVAGISGHTVTLQNRGEIALPVDVDVTMDSGEKKSFVWPADSETQDLTVDASGRIAKVEVDPKQEWLDIDRTNNSMPRRLRVRPMLLYYPLYDLPIFLPDDSYNLVFGPEIHDGIGLKASIQKPYDRILYAGADYDVNNKWQTSRIGYQLNHLGGAMRTFGVEVANRVDHDNGEDDLTTGKMFVRQELWPAEYGLTDVNDHVTWYLIRNETLNGTKLFGGAEDIRNASYLRHSESIVGTALHFGRGRPYPDPREGFTVDWMIENSGHFLGATQQFTRSAIDYRIYEPVTMQSKVATRLKYGWGSVDDKNLYELGGIDGLRGFDRKTVRGANALLGSLEYRFPLLNNLDLHFLDNILGLDKVSGVAFVDAGQSWYGDLSDSKLRKDAGVGLRLHMNFASFVEQAIVRIDAAQAINDDENDIHYWFGVNQAF
jgi:hypothetical protein